MNIIFTNAKKYEAIIKEVLTETTAVWGEGGVYVTLDKCDEGIRIVSDGKDITLYYSTLNSLFRGIGVIIAKGETEYEITEKLSYKHFGCMVDCSRNAVLNMASVKRFLKISALLGFNTIQLYTEDTYEIESEPYFGHLRGRYTVAELQEIDAYAESLGIEAVPCIQTLAHLDAIFEWPCYKKIRDKGPILNVGLEETYEFIDKMLAASKKAFKTNKINIGMDEAHELGRGKYMDMFGYKKKSEIMKEHLARVMELCRKHGYEPMMWSDMFFRVCSPTDDYYDKSIVLSEDVIKSVPEEVNLVFWNYHFTNAEDYEHMLDKHMLFNRKVSFAGGVWTWLGFAPAQKYAVNVARHATTSLKKYDLDTVLVTIWGDNGAEASAFSPLPTLVAYAEGGWNGDTSDESIESKMAVLGASYRDFLEMDLLLYKRMWSIVHKYMLYNDPLLGTWDYHIPEDANEFFSNAANVFEGCAQRNPKWAYIFNALEKLASVLATKATLGIKLKTAYDNKDKDELGIIANETIPYLIEETKDFISAHRRRWRVDNKNFGFDVQDIRLGGLIQRLEATAETVNAYLAGELDRIEEFEAPRLADKGGAELNLLGEGSDGKQGSLTDAYIWSEIYSKSRK
ncbi:MAG: beta-N-acetylhexosaminidase [Ruminococcaceae bacterium]|nr:beta-N-acetylhexosaminidase [Oscillospiraceae bacterium]